MPEQIDLEEVSNDTDVDEKDVQKVLLWLVSDGWLNTEYIEQIGQ